MAAVVDWLQGPPWVKQLAAAGNIKPAGSSCPDGTQHLPQVPNTHQKHAQNDEIKVDDVVIFTTGMYSATQIAPAPPVCRP